MSEPVKLRAHSQAHCKDCSLAPLCLPLSLNLEDMEALDDIVKRGRPLKKRRVPVSPGRHVRFRLCSTLRRPEDFQPERWR